MPSAQFAVPAYRPTPTPERAEKVAVILNKNAKRVSERVRQRILEAIPEADVFLTESIEQARFVTRRVVDSGYGTIATGGGDGTVANAIQTVLDEVDRAQVPRPRFAVLKLGTGNAVADFLGARSYARDLREIAAAKTRKLDLLRVDGQTRTTFAGFGWDAFILNNYEQMKQSAERFAITRALFKSAAGYLISGLGKSFPQLLLRRPRWTVRIINTGEMAFRRNADGHIIERYAPGDVVYDGRFRLACFGTTPYYGFKFNIMPLADHTDGLFHLRLVDMNPISAVRRLYQAWTGRLRHPKVTDLQLSACRMEFDDDVPFQISGDAAGTRRSIDVALDQPIDCVHFID